jgi:inward rectifier potassium channel
MVEPSAPAQPSRAAVPGKGVPGKGLPGKGLPGKGPGKGKGNDVVVKKRSYQIHVIGAKRIAGDWYHALLRMTWAPLVGFIGVAFLLINAAFALAFYFVGGVAHARPGSFADAFYFSVQTMGTIGYGAMYPESQGANVIVVVEAVISLVVTALATGLVFSKFARPIGRVAFSRYAVISPMDGVPMLMLRVGNERGNSIVEATLHMTLSRTVRTTEGVTFYKLVDLKLVRERSPAVSRSWTVLHRIDESSPLFGATPESLAGEEVELMATLSGTDDTSYQPVHARHEYEHDEILWGHRHADILSETESGDLMLDIRRFHDTVPTQPTADFPYPRPAAE